MKLEKYSYPFSPFLFSSFYDFSRIWTRSSERHVCLYPIRKFILVCNCQQGETYWKRLQLICNLPTCRLSESIRLKLNTFENEYVYERTRIYIYFVNFPKSNLNCISRGKISPFRFASSNRLASTRAQKKEKGMRERINGKFTSSLFRSQPGRKMKG